ncbi:phosphatidylinositol 4,5-bisphosphate 5-phosphatase A isoform X2 [Dromiciops gliroides]|uniref:phosphatidylinositol 4,5-bisphosphate 5-phosphatase A isoform X2 n=1 Tax=Dromiciops gliroides TaxID=33562 RepID=UPI001CC7D003|nr:phosphatidylinositol 4,5-bisphosphate 5-phosphatase A isoform X2 [Dromiciops gliroides]
MEQQRQQQGSSGGPRRPGRPAPPRAAPEPGGLAKEQAAPRPLGQRPRPAPMGLSPNPPTKEQRPSLSSTVEQRPALSPNSTLAPVGPWPATTSTGHRPSLTSLGPSLAPSPGEQGQPPVSTGHRPSLTSLGPSLAPSRAEQGQPPVSTGPRPSLTSLGHSLAPSPGEQGQPPVSTGPRPSLTSLGHSLAPSPGEQGQPPVSTGPRPSLTSLGHSLAPSRAEQGQPPVSTGPRPSLTSLGHSLAPSPGEQGQPPVSTGPRPSLTSLGHSLAPSHAEQGQPPVSTGPRPSLTSLGPSLAPLPGEQGQPPVSTGPRPSLTSLGHSLAPSHAEQGQPPVSTGPRPSLTSLGPSLAPSPGEQGQPPVSTGPRPSLTSLGLSPTPSLAGPWPAAPSPSSSTSSFSSAVESKPFPTPPVEQHQPVSSSPSSGQRQGPGSSGLNPGPPTIEQRRSSPSPQGQRVAPASTSHNPALSCPLLCPASSPVEQRPLSPSGEPSWTSLEPAPAPSSRDWMHSEPRLTPSSERLPVPRPQGTGGAGTPSPAGTTHTLSQTSANPSLSLSFRPRPEAPRNPSPEDSLLPRPPQALPLDTSHGQQEAGTRSPVLLSPVSLKPTFPTSTGGPVALPKPPPSPNRSPNRSPGTSHVNVAAHLGAPPPKPPEASPSKTIINGTSPSGHRSAAPPVQAPQAPLPSSPSGSAWSAQSTCKGDPGFRLQEVNSMINQRLKDALFTDQWSELFMDALGPFNFVMVSTVRMQGVILLVFAKYYHLPFLRDIQTDCTRTGLGGYWGNKGGVSIRLSVFGHMVCFLNCHLPAHMDKAEQRKENFMTILNMQQFEGPMAHGILDHDIVFWFGDLNFRIESYDLHFVKFAIDNNQLQKLWEKDQLNMAKGSWPVLRGFQEGPLTFAPTFKFDVGTNYYDTSAKKRKPAWTDRILWKIKAPSGGPSPSGRESHRVQVTQQSYRSHMEYTVSDHKPVAALFVLQFAYREDVPLVRIEVADEWLRPDQAVARYRMESVFSRSSWDWIGLYRVGFRHCKDYVAYVWAKHEDVDGTTYQVTFSEESLPRGGGEFILGYYSHSQNILIGVTDPFQISLPASDEGSSPTDSSRASSEGEDDSTLELLGPKSRSPSPGKMKRHRSRSPGLAKFPGLVLRPSSRERGTSRSPSPQGHRPLKSSGSGLKTGPKAKEKKGKASSGPEEDDPPLPEIPGPWNFALSSSLPRPVPRTLGLLPSLRLEPILGSQWRAESEQEDQISPKSPSHSPRSPSPSPKSQPGIEDGPLGP